MLKYVFVVIFTLAIAHLALAQNNRTTQPARGGMPSIKPVFAEQMIELENELAKLLQTQRDASGNRPPAIELQIDIRLLTRWAMLQAMAARPDSDGQIVAFLRARNFQRLIPLVETSIKSQPQLAPAQIDAIGRLHQLTFKLPDAHEPAQLDATCKDIAMMLATALGPSAGNPQQLPMMRPSQVIRAPSPNGVAAGQPRTLAQWAAAARTAAVSVPLRQQLLALADRATQESNGSGDDTEAKVLESMLIEAVSLAQGLQNNTAVAPDARSKIETQLAEGLALFLDPRTRPIAKTRLDELDQYRKTVSRVGAMQLTQDTQKQLAPAFVWANENPQAGAKVLDAIEKMTQEMARFQARRKPVGLPLAHQKAVTALEQKFTAQVATFLDDAEDLSGGGMMGGNPSDLPPQVDEMRRTLDLMEVIPQIGKMQDTLLSYRPRPTGALEKRITIAVMDATTEEGKPAADAARLLSDLVKLAEASQALSQRTTLKLSPAVDQGYARGRVPAVIERGKTMIGETVTKAAAPNGEFDRAGLARINTILTVIDSLERAQQLEDALAKTKSLQRWADWDTRPGELESVLTPYRDATAAALEGFSSGSNQLLDQWPIIERKFEPVINLLPEISAYDEACASLPEGLPGEIAKLATPMDYKPFGHVRYASFGLAVWNHYEQSVDLDSANQAAAALGRRLQRRNP